MSANSRQAVGVEAIGPNTPAWSRSTAGSAMVSPPSASVTAGSVAIRPGSCPVPRRRSGPGAAEYAAVGPVASARSAGSRTPACPPPRTIGTDMDLGTQPDSPHGERALRLDRQNPSARFIAQDQEGAFAFPPQTPPYPSETARLSATNDHDLCGRLNYQGIKPPLPEPREEGRGFRKASAKRFRHYRQDDETGRESAPHMYSRLGCACSHRNIEHVRVHP